MRGSVARGTWIGPLCCCIELDGSLGSLVQSSHTGLRTEQYHQHSESYSTIEDRYQHQRRLWCHGLGYRIHCRGRWSLQLCFEHIQSVSLSGDRVWHQPVSLRPTCSWSPYIIMNQQEGILNVRRLHWHWHTNVFVFKWNTININLTSQVWGYYFDYYTSLFC